MTERIGVFGGTFDPPHIAHLALAAQARHQLGLDRVLFVVANVPWQKASARQISDPDDRYEMVRDAVAGRTGLEASRMEIDRGGESYTADTLAELASPGRELFLLIGSDLVSALATWKRWEELPPLSTLAIVTRPGGFAVAQPAPQWRWVEVRMPALEISSSELRAMVGEGRPIDFLVPDSVAAHVRRRSLYRW